MGPQGSGALLGCVAVNESGWGLLGLQPRIWQTDNWCTVRSASDLCLRPSSTQSEPVCLDAPWMQFVLTWQLVSGPTAKSAPPSETGPWGLSLVMLVPLHVPACSAKATVHSHLCAFALHGPAGSWLSYLCPMSQPCLSSFPIEGLGDSVPLGPGAPGCVTPGNLVPSELAAQRKGSQTTSPLLAFLSCVRGQQEHEK